MPPVLRRWIGAVLVSAMVLLGVGPLAFPADPLTVDVELYYDSTWNNINAYTYHRDAAPITITRGRTAEGKRCEPGRLNLQLNNRDGRFTPRNPNSPLFGKIGRNTPIRVRVTHDAVTYARFVGEVTSWPSRWDVSGRDVWVPIEAAGILRRLGQGTKPLRSPLFRSMSGIAPGDYIPHAYWPLEDGPDARVFASGLPNGQPVTPSGATFATDGALVSSDLLPALSSTGSIEFPVPAYEPTDRWWVQHAFRIPNAPAYDPAGTETEMLEIFVAGGHVERWRLFFYSTTTAGVQSASVIIRGYDATGAQVNSGLAALNPSLTTLPDHTDVLQDGMPAVITFGVIGDTPSPGQYRFYFGVSIGAENIVSTGSAATGVIGTITRARLNGNATEPVYGHFGVWVDSAFGTADAVNNVQAMLAWDGETVEDRLARLCDQAGIPFSTTAGGSALMGAERKVTLLQALRDAEDVDQGFLHESRDALGLHFRTNSSRYGQVPVQLDYGEGHISPPFDPEPDDQNVANDREVKRRNGSQARRELTSGPLSVQDPPDGVGRYDDSIELDAYSDDQLEHIAGWRLHVGTWDAERYPRVRVDLSANPDLIPQIAGLDSGDQVRITNLPAWLPPEDAELLVEGYREVIAFYTWDFVFNMSPAGPYNVVGRWALLSHELHSAVNDSTASIDIANTDVTQPMLATSAADVGAGYGISINGEDLTLTAVAASTITFGNTGTASTGGSGSRTPGLPTGSASGNLILIFASTRNSGAGTVDTPSNWTRLDIFPSAANCQVFARIYDGVWSMPTVTYTGGAANEDTIAQSCRLAGKWHSAANILIGSAHCLNASAANITYPGLSLPICDDAIILYFAWKQDDYTSITGPGTEIQEASSTAGNDASQSWAYSIQTTATPVASNVFTPTGGASAISRGAIAALRCDYETATVTRSVNGVTASHSAGDDVTVTRPMRWGLV